MLRRRESHSLSQLSKMEVETYFPNLYDQGRKDKREMRQRERERKGTDAHYETLLLYSTYSSPIPLSTVVSHPHSHHHNILLQLHSLPSSLSSPQSIKIHFNAMCVQYVSISIRICTCSDLLCTTGKTQEERKNKTIETEDTILCTKYRERKKRLQ